MKERIGRLADRAMSLKTLFEKPTPPHQLRNHTIVGTLIIMDNRPKPEILDHAETYHGCPTMRKIVSLYVHYLDLLDEVRKYVQRGRPIFNEARKCHSKLFLNSVVARYSK